MNGPFKTCPAPNGKVYVTWDDTWGDQPICDQSGDLRYFEDEQKAVDFVERFHAEGLLDRHAVLVSQ